MGGRASKQKGYRGEAELVKLIPGSKRVPLSGALQGLTNDVELPNGMRVEVKRRKSGFTTLYSWIEDQREKPDLVALRTDNNPWIVCMQLPKFLELINKKQEDKPNEEQIKYALLACGALLEAHKQRGAILTGACGDNDAVILAQQALGLRPIKEENTNGECTE